MKVTWQADDINKGVHVCRPHAAEKTRSVIAFQNIYDAGARYCVYNIVTHVAERPMTRQEVAHFLNENGYIPTGLLTLQAL